MKSEPKTFASLSSGLLARKGAARPAMRPQGFGQIGAAGLEDLGWNDMGFEAPKAAVLPIRDADHDGFGDAVPEPALRNPVGGLTPFSPVHIAQAEIAQRFVQDAQDAHEDDLDESAETFDLSEIEAVAANAVTPVYEPAEEIVAAAFEAPIEAPAEIVAQAPAEIVAQAPVPVAAPPVFKAQPARSVHSRAAPSGKAKAAFTLRLAPDRHLKLRLACATTNRSAQMLVTDALDAFLATMPELDAMAKKVPTPSATQAADKE